MRYQEASSQIAAEPSTVRAVLKQRVETGA